MGEAEIPSGLVQGTLEMPILRTLALEPMHGYGIGVRLEQISCGALRAAITRVLKASLGEL